MPPIILNWAKLGVLLLLLPHRSVGWECKRSVNPKDFIGVTEYIRR